MIDTEVFYRNLAIDSANRRITWLRDLAERLERGDKTDITDINGLRSLATSFERGIK